MKKTIVIIATLFILIFGGLLGHYISNKYNYTHKKIDESTSYEVLKEVEGSCRSMISSYEKDKLIYQQNINSADSLDVEMAKAAKMRANNTAIQYNEYILKNSYIWKDNVPKDIRTELEIIE